MIEQDTGSDVPTAGMELQAKLHTLLAEALRCLEDGRLDAARRKVAYADALVHDLAAEFKREIHTCAKCGPECSC